MSNAMSNANLELPKKKTKSSKSVRYFDQASRQDFSPSTPSLFFQQRGRKQSRKSFSARAVRVASVYFDPLEYSIYRDGKCVVCLKFISLVGILLTIGSALVGFYTAMLVLQSQSVTSRKLDIVDKILLASKHEIQTTNDTYSSILAEKLPWKTVEDIEQNISSETSKTYSDYKSLLEKIELETQRKYLKDYNELLSYKVIATNATSTAQELLDLRKRNHDELEIYRAKADDKENRFNDMKKWIDLIYAEGCTGAQGLNTIAVRSRRIRLWCDMTVDGGNWLVIQRRVDGDVSFERSMVDYERGFGTEKENFWIGLQNLYDLLFLTKYYFRIDMWDFQGKHAYANYSDIQIANDYEDFAMKLNGFNGTAGNSFPLNKWMKFSTKDYNSFGSNCSTTYRSGWWFGDNCTNIQANLNGVYRYPDRGITASEGISGIYWKSWKSEPLMRIEMKIKMVEARFN